MKKSLESQYAHFMSEIKEPADPVSPRVDLRGPAVTEQPYATLSCEIEQAEGDAKTVVRNARLLLYLDYDSDVYDGIYIDLTLEASLQSVHVLFKDDAIPVELLICQPNLTCIQAIIAHTVAKKVGYAISVEELPKEDKVLFTLDLGNGNLFEAKVERDTVAKYFGWKALTREEKVRRAYL